ncbi:nuclear hormone receptor family member nhr-8-like [Haliotis rubra]|uniref:nuclear hormone receptor family member nhr-8-like n=1 Tax=Haliotis rubra TaxID=36100 RepID=UPI001EE5AED5|nr:nuclear hormone receptor family member nhr-8-like [Haliotis rubra]XP_046543923.1 nuclear hormone receptor family member nhr-8-like [Haliotis rubra]
MPPGAIPFPFGDCRICNDRATGVHYGLATCEGCKGFFKRSIPKGDKYKCFFGGQCIITPQNRNRCKSCRYRKCLELGMSFEAVKMGRIPKMEKQRALDAARNPGGCAESPDSGIDDDAFNAVARHVTDHVTNQLTNQVTSQMSKLLSSDVAPHQFCSYGNSSGEVPRPQSSSSYQHVATHLYSEAFPHVPWNDDIGSFSEPNRDQPKEPCPVDNLDGSGTSNMNLLAETALLPKTSKSSVPEAASVSDDSNTSSNSCSMYSPNVIKVLFNQVVEMTGGNKVSEIVIEKLAKKCPDNSSMRLLKRLSSETYINTASNTTETASSVPNAVRESGQEWSPLAGQLFTSSGCQSSNWNKTGLKQDSFSPSEQQTKYFESSVFLHDDDPSDTIGSTASSRDMVWMPSMLLAVTRTSTPVNIQINRCILFIKTCSRRIRPIRFKVRMKVRVIHGIWIVLLLFQHNQHNTPILLNPTGHMIRINQSILLTQK